MSSRTDSRVLTLAAWLQHLVDDLAAGRVDLDTVTSLAADDLINESPLCPHCARFPVRQGRTGYRDGVCTPCALTALNDARLERIRTIELDRANTSGRQALARARRAAGIPAAPRPHA